MSNKNRIIKIIVGIIAVIVLIVVGFIGTKLVITNIKEKELKNKLSQINAEELEEQLIEELKKTSINFSTNSKDSSGVAISMDTLFISTNEISGEPDTTYSKAIKDYVIAIGCGYKNDNSYPIYILPCFKIECDDDGNLKNITYLYSNNKNTIEYIVAKTIEDFMLEEYDIDINKADKKFIKDDSDTDIELAVTENYLTSYIVQALTESSNSKEPKMNTRTFGVDIDK